MKRSQVYILDSQWQRLNAISKQCGESVAALIRAAIDKEYSKGTEIDFDRALQKGFGIWKNRDEMKDTDRYLRKLRSDKRMERFYAGSAD